jgi:hypothetical protein
MVALPTMLPVTDAAQKYGLDETLIRSLVESGRIKGAMIGDELIVKEADTRRAAGDMEPKPVEPINREDLPEYKKHAHLAGTPIWISKAGRKYGVIQRTVSNWVKSGFIKVLGYEKNRKLLDEADVAYCAEVYAQNKGQGKWAFDKDGLPYKPKTGPLAG